MQPAIRGSNKSMSLIMVILDRVSEVALLPHTNAVEVIVISGGSRNLQRVFSILV